MSDTWCLQVVAVLVLLTECQLLTLGVRRTHDGITSSETRLPPPPPRGFRYIIQEFGLKGHAMFAIRKSAIIDSSYLDPLAMPEASNILRA